jgi:ketosteroid isomerase-like protein
MSEANGQNNIAQVQRMSQAFNHRDLDALLELIDPEVELIPIMAALEGHAYRGHDGVRQWVEDLATDWEFFETHQEEFREMGNRVLIFGRWRGGARKSSIELEGQPASWLVDLREGRVIRLQTFTDRREAIEAARRDPSP